jgi:hypothetical protein
LLQEHKRWEIVLGALGAISTLRAQLGAAQRMALPLTGRSRAGTGSGLGIRGAATSGPGAGDLLQRDRTLSRDSMDSADGSEQPSALRPSGGSNTSVGSGAGVPTGSGSTTIKKQPLSARLRAANNGAGLRLSRANSSTNENNAPLPPTSNSTPTALLSSRSQSSLASPASVGSGGSHFTFAGPTRRRERLSGGLRRAPPSVEADGDVDIAVQEHDQSLSESVHTFLQAPLPWTRTRCAPCCTAATSAQ